MQVAEKLIEASGTEEAFGPHQQGVGVGGGQALARDRRGWAKFGGHQAQRVSATPSWRAS